jgi:hypothetical protein
MRSGRGGVSRFEISPGESILLPPTVAAVKDYEDIEQLE